MENKIRNTLNEIYFGKTKDIVNGLRSTVPASELKQRDNLMSDLSSALKSRTQTQANWCWYDVDVNQSRGSTITHFVSPANHVLTAHLCYRKYLLAIPCVQILHSLFLNKPVCGLKLETATSKQYK